MGNTHSLVCARGEQCRDSIFGLSFLISHVVHNEMIQGLLMLVAGAVTLAAVGVYARNRPSQQLPAAPTA